MNFHSDEWIMDRVKEHYEEALTLFPEDKIVGIFYQGSGNYGLDTEFSDVDTKLVVLPSIEDIIFNKTPVSTTHVRENKEHIDLKDLRLMLKTFRKQNINFIEILFTKYKILNPRYEKFWNELIEHREEIARYDEVAAVKAIKGMALEKYHALEHRYPAKVDIIDKYGYDGKQLSHMIRLFDFLLKYKISSPYEKCLISYHSELLKDIKNQGYYSLETAREIADMIKSWIEEEYNKYIETHEQKIDIEVDKLLDKVQKEIMLESIYGVTT